MALNARLVVLVSTAELETLHRLAHERGWPMSRMARHFIAQGVRAEERRQVKRFMRERVAAKFDEQERMRMLPDPGMGVRNADS